MNIQAIIYSSNAGHTKEYAELFAKISGLPLYDLKHSGNAPKGAEIVYFGWIMGGMISGLKKAEKSFTVVAAAGTGASEDTAEQRSSLSKVNELPPERCFYLRGGLDIDRVHGIYKMMLKAVLNSAAKDPAKSNDKSTLELTQMLKTPKSYVDEKNLTELAAWYNARK